MIDVDAPKTYKAFEEEALCERRRTVTCDELRSVLKGVGVRGYSRMKQRELREAVEASAEASAGLDELVRSTARCWRWRVARGLGVGYAALTEIEASAGVTPDFGDGCGRRGCYRSFADARRVYEAAGAASARWVSLRISGISSPGEAAFVLDALAASCVVGEAEERRWDDGTVALYLDVRERG